MNPELIDREVIALFREWGEVHYPASWMDVTSGMVSEFRIWVEERGPYPISALNDSFERDMLAEYRRQEQGLPATASTERCLYEFSGAT